MFSNSLNMLFIYNKHNIFLTQISQSEFGLLPGCEDAKEKTIVANRPFIIMMSTVSKLNITVMESRTYYIKKYML